MYTHNLHYITLTGLDLKCNVIYSRPSAWISDSVYLEGLAFGGTDTTFTIVSKHFSFQDAPFLTAYDLNPNRPYPGGIYPIDLDNTYTILGATFKHYQRLHHIGFQKTDTYFRNRKV